MAIKKTSISALKKKATKSVGGSSGVSTSKGASSGSYTPKAKKPNSTSSGFWATKPSTGWAKKPTRITGGWGSIKPKANPAPGRWKVYKSSSKWKPPTKK